MAGSNVLALMLLHSLRPMLDTDPALVILSILVTLDIASDFLALAWWEKTREA